MEQNVVITNGTGQTSIVNGSYTVTTNTNGYDNTSILPTTLDVVEGTNTYDFTISATGTLTLHVTEDGTIAGTPIVGATFNRCDSAGNTYGSLITTDSNGDAVFNNVPYADTNAPTIYYKQVSSDISHTFDATLKNTTMTTSMSTIEVENPAAQTRTINLTDANYTNLPIESGSITLTAN